MLPYLVYTISAWFRLFDNTHPRAFDSVDDLLEYLVVLFRVLPTD